MIYIYTHSVTQRLQYTLDVLFKTILQTEYTIVDKSTFEQIEGQPKINYSFETLKADFSIHPHTLLFEESIEEQDIAVTHRKGVPFFFMTGELDVFPFDIFASSFYMLSRYEEYLPFQADVHGRFSAKQSLAYKAGFLQLPVVHLWAKVLQQQIQNTYPDYNFPQRAFKQYSSIDVDIAYAYKGKPFVRAAGAGIKSLLRLDIFDLWSRFRTLFGANDPYDTYDYLQKLHQKAGVESLYFFQVGAYGKYDKNLPLNKRMTSLIRRIKTCAGIGLHPSYASNASFEILQAEKQKLESVLEEPVIRSRQHYLKLQFPLTYERLIRAGISEDYTMGFADYTGFRAGMALPFPFFNVEKNAIRPLQIVPFQIMDGTLKDYMQLRPETAADMVQHIKKRIAEVHGEMWTVLHNSSVTNRREMKGWLPVFESIFKK